MMGRRWAGESDFNKFEKNCGQYKSLDVDSIILFLLTCICLCIHQTITCLN